jgi:hypothetical protein
MEKMIEEMAKVLHDRIINKTWRAKKVAEELYKIAVPEGSVVLTREGQERIEQRVSALEKRAEELKQARKETAREILTDISQYLKRYAHIHKYAEEARETTEEYADGSPVEMESVWDVISLHKNGYDDYETMSQLQDNIMNIAKSFLLQELERDFRLYAKQFGLEVE